MIQTRPQKPQTKDGKTNFSDTDKDKSKEKPSAKELNNHLGNSTAVGDSVDNAGPIDQKVDP